jgi:hypothetical protein
MCFAISDPKKQKKVAQTDIPVWKVVNKEKDKYVSSCNGFVYPKSGEVVACGKDGNPITEACVEKKSASYGLYGYIYDPKKKEKILKEWDEALVEDTAILYGVIPKGTTYYVANDGYTILTPKLIVRGYHVVRYEEKTFTITLTVKATVKAGSAANVRADFKDAEWDYAMEDFISSDIVPGFKISKVTAV